MSPDSLSESLQKGFRVTLGATASLLEAFQDPQGASQKFSEIGSDFNRLTEEFETKGESTEQEARQFVDSMMTQMPNPFQQAAGGSAAQTVNTTAVPVTDPSIQIELEELTQDIAQIRQEIESLKNEDR
jgi:polyhydroxyalkanoate synthesis regulator phasin